MYSCDHFVYPECELGRIGEKSIAELVFSLRQLGFGLDRFNKLPTECYLCSGWKRFYAHVPVAPRRPIGDPKLVPAVALVRPRPAT